MTVGGMGFIPERLLMMMMMMTVGGMGFIPERLLMMMMSNPRTLDEYTPRQYWSANFIISSNNRFFTGGYPLAEH